MQHDMHGFDGILSKNTIVYTSTSTWNWQRFAAGYTTGVITPVINTRACCMYASYPPLEAIMAGSNHHGRGKYSPAPLGIGKRHGQFILSYGFGGAESIDVSSSYSAECWTNSDSVLSVFLSVSLGGTDDTTYMVFKDPLLPLQIS